MTAHSHGHGAHGKHGGHGSQSLNALAASATLHCLTGCAIGEVLGMVIGTAVGLSNWATIVLAVLLAFAFGYGLTMVPLVRAGLALAVAVPLAFASDTFSIAVMEIVDNAVMLLVPGAMDAGLADALFWGPLAFALGLAYVFAFPVNRYLIARGQGHAVVHAFHGHGSHAEERPRAQAVSVRLLALFGVTALTVAVGMGAIAAAVESGSGAHDEDVAAGEHGAEVAASGLAVASARYRLELQQDTLPLGRTLPFTFRILGTDGTPLRRADEHGGVQLHLIVVRRDGSGYQHLHPAPTADGAWRTALRLPKAGVYRAFVDFERDGEKTVLASDLFVGGVFEPQPAQEPARFAAVGGYQIALDVRGRSGADRVLEFTITRNGRAVDVEPYLGADGHLVALRAGDLAYLHVHPLEGKRPGVVEFAATFPSAATYRLYLQFEDVGRVRTAPFTLDVATTGSSVDNRPDHDDREQNE